MSFSVCLTASKADHALYAVIFNQGHAPYSVIFNPDYTLHTVIVTKGHVPYCDIQPEQCFMYSDIQLWLRSGTAILNYAHSPNTVISDHDLRTVGFNHSHVPYYVIFNPDYAVNTVIFNQGHVLYTVVFNPDHDYAPWYSTRDTFRIL